LIEVLSILIILIIPFKGEGKYSRRENFLPEKKKGAAPLLASQGSKPLTAPEKRLEIDSGASNIEK